MVFTCRACGRNTSRGGFILHLQKSNNPRCKAYLQQIESELPESSESDSDEDNGYGHAQPRFGPALMQAESSSWEDSESPVVQSQGDFFGDYKDYDEAEFGMDVDISSGDSEGSDTDGHMDETGGDDDTDEDDLQFEVGTVADEADDAELEGGLEPERLRGLPTQVNILENTNDNGDGVVNNRAEIEQPLKNRPFVVKFGGKAGTPMTENHAILTQDSDDLQYGSSLGNSDIIYAPFSSRLEWEIDRWAKLRGPSSTAFSELMMIEGVSKSI